MANVNDPVLGVDQFNQPVFASEYYANPTAFSVQDTPAPAPAVTAAAPAETANTSIEDQVLGLDQHGQPVYASEYYANPAAFSVQDTPAPAAPVTADAGINNPVLGVDQYGQPVYASEYYANPAAFSVQEAPAPAAAPAAPKRAVKPIG